MRNVCIILLLSCLMSAQKLRTRLYGDMDLEADIAFKNPIVYHGVSSSGCAQAVTLADNTTLIPVWQKQVDDGFGCGACVEEWKLPTDIKPKPEIGVLVYWVKDGDTFSVVSHDFSNVGTDKFKSGLRVYPTCIGAPGWGVWHSATAEQK